MGILEGELDYASEFTLQEQLSRIVRDSIIDNELPVGYKLPTEETFCKAYDVSRSTIRAAIRELELDGMVARVQGKGTFVTGGKVKRKMEKVYSFSGQMRELQKNPKSEILQFSEMDIDDKMSNIFALKKPEQVYLIKRIRYADNFPMLLETTYIPVYLYPKLTREKVEGNSLYDLLKNEAGVSPYEAEETYESVVMYPEVCKALKCSCGSCGFFIERIAKMQTGTVYEYTNSYMRGDSSKLSITLRENSCSVVRNMFKE